MNTWRLIDKVRKSIKFIKISGVKNDEYLEKASLQLILDVKTRWGSTFNMLNRFVKVVEIVNAVLEKYKKEIFSKMEIEKIQ